MGFYSLGLLHQWQSTGTERHWLLPLNEGIQYRVASKLCTSNELVELTHPQPQADQWRP